MCFAKINFWCSIHVNTGSFATIDKYSVVLADIDESWLFECCICGPYQTIFSLFRNAEMPLLQSSVLLAVALVLAA